MVMNSNPFLETSALNAPLSGDKRAQIYYSALRAAARGGSIEAQVLPVGESLHDLRRRMAMLGVEALLAHPSDLDDIFRGVTLAVYQKIAALYCSKAARSINMVWSILVEMARQPCSGLSPSVLPVDYRAVWAICLYLAEQRSQRIRVAVEQAQGEWWLVVLRPDVRVTDSYSASSAFAPCVLCVLDVVRPRVIAFRIASEVTLNPSLSLVLYDAIASQRKPAERAHMGLSWTLPVRICSTVALPPECLNTLTCLGVDLPGIDLAGDTGTGYGSGALPLLAALKGRWDRDLSGCVHSVPQFSALFDNYLHRVHGHGPLRWKEEREQMWAHLIEYSRDPAWQFPALRSLLPAGKGHIAEDGTVEYEGLHYANSLLGYWLGRQVTVKQSEHDRTRSWIYLDGDVLCWAKARESNPQIVAAQKARAASNRV
jgi:hypothetical protein